MHSSEQLKRFCDVLQTPSTAHTAVPVYASGTGSANIVKTYILKFQTFELPIYEMQET